MPQLKFLTDNNLEKRVKTSAGVSQIRPAKCCSSVDTLSDALVVMKTNQARPDIAAVFHAQYGRIARVIASIIRDPGRAEELAVEVFLKWSRTPRTQGENVEGWLYRTAVRIGQNELRRKITQSKYDRLFAFVRGVPTPEELLVAQEQQRRIDVVLSAIEPCQAELLVLRSHGFSYDELASMLDLNSSSIGTFLSRAQRAFRKEYVRRYESK